LAHATNGRPASRHPPEYLTAASARGGGSEHRTAKDPRALPGTLMPATSPFPGQLESLTTWKVGQRTSFFLLCRAFPALPGPCQIHSATHPPPQQRRAASSGVPVSTRSTCSSCMPSRYLRERPTTATGALPEHEAKKRHRDIGYAVASAIFRSTCVTQDIRFQSNPSSRDNPGRADVGTQQATR
jgi:hypothetical protein